MDQVGHFVAETVVHLGTSTPYRRVSSEHFVKGLGPVGWYKLVLNSKAIDKSVSPGDIHDGNLPLDEIRRRIRDDHIADATVTIVLIGPCTPCIIVRCVWMEGEFSFRG